MAGADSESLLTELQSVELHDARAASSGVAAAGVADGQPSSVGGDVVNANGGSSTGGATQVDAAAVSDAAAAIGTSKLTPCGPSMPGPPWVRNILVTEACERFCWYGLRAVLVLYLKGPLGYSDNAAIALFSWTSSLGYFMPMLGGIVADSWLGKYHTILYFCLIYLVGSGVLSASSLSPGTAGCVVGLLMIATGMGGIKSCVAPFGADQFSPQSVRRASRSSSWPDAPRPRRRSSLEAAAIEADPAREAALAGDPAVAEALSVAVSRYFALFYLSINIGALASYVVTPLLREHVGFPAAFGAPFILLAAAVVIFWAGRHAYRRTMPSGSVLALLFRIYAAAAREQWSTCRRGGPKRSFVEYARGQFRSADVDAARDLWAILPMFGTFAAFWACFDQQGSSWTLQAKSMDTHGIPPEQMGVVNSLFVVILIPILDRGVYPWLRRLAARGGRWSMLMPTPLRKIGCGMVICASAFVVSAMVQSSIDAAPPNTVSLAWQIPQYFLITSAELCISITGLEFAYSQAPPSLKGSIMALFLLTNSIGDAAIGIIYGIFGDLGQVELFYVFAVLTLATLAVFLCIAHGYVYRDDRTPGGGKPQARESGGAELISGDTALGDADRYAAPTVVQ